MKLVKSGIGNSHIAYADFFFKTYIWTPARTIRRKKKRERQKMNHKPQSSK